MSQVLLAYCRPGFEAECAQELTAREALLGGGGHARTVRGSGFVEFVGAHTSALAHAAKHLIFARQAFGLIGSARDVPTQDRLSVLLPIIENDPRRWADAWVESSDSDEGRALAPLCRALNAALITALKRCDRIDRASPWRLHVMLAASNAACVGAACIEDASPWLGGIPRLKFPRSAPSRSTLKLEEALLVLLDARERERWLKPGLRAVDLGASPGGWTWQLVARGLHVTAIDNGPMDAALLASGQVEHLRVDGFRYRPQRAVDWLVCDMVEQPRRVAALIGDWLVEGHAARAVFNLKLPMKKRWDEVQLCLGLVRDSLSASGRSADLRAKQLYHDREEITVYAGHS